MINKERILSLFSSVDKATLHQTTSGESCSIFSIAWGRQLVSLTAIVVEERNLDNKINNEQLTREFISFLIDDNINDGKYVDLISEFVLKYENNLEVQKTLTAIREGSIIYIGLNYNINDIGNMKKTLTLYLATEVLFSLHGLNGEIHKQLAQDLYSQVRDINIKNKKIKLRCGSYFCNSPLLNFICRYIPLKQWPFDDSHSPKYQKFKVDERPRIITYKQP